MKKRKKTDMPPLIPEEEEDDTQVRGGSGAKWITLLCIVLTIALIVASLPSGISAVTKVNSKVLSAVPEENTISTVLSGGGTLSPQEGTAQSLPQALELETYYVKNGQTVSEGDPIAQVDLVAVKAAISELQEVLYTLDAAIASESSKTNDSVIRSGTAGRVKKIYAREGTAAADTVYENGALLLLSLDGLMAVDLEARAEVGQRVTVTLSDGTALEGTVESVSDGTATVTLSDETAPLDDSVTVTTKDGETLGTGNLYIHSRLRVTGAYGTVSQISVKENRQVSAGSALLTLKDTGHTAEYARLLNRRTELEDQMESLVRLSKDGILRADCGGTVSGVDTEISYTDPAVLTQTRSQASPGYTALGGIRTENTDTPQAQPSGEDQRQNPDGNQNPGTGSGQNPGEGENPQPGTGGSGTDETETATYILGQVTDASRLSEGVLTYAVQKTIRAEELATQSFADMLDPTVPVQTQELTYTKQTVLLSTGGAWIESGFEQISEGDAILIGVGIIVYQKTGTSIPGGMPSIDPSQFPGISTGIAGAGSALSGMASMAGGMSGYGTAAKTAAYDSYDTTKKDAAVITADEEMTVQIQVDELDIRTLETGMEATVTLDALPGSSFTGAITAINPYGENSGGNTKYTVTVTLPRDEKMLSGMNASVKITTGVSGTVPTVPAAAVVFDAGKSWLYTGYNEKTDTLTDPVEIQTGLSDGSLVELLSGLSEGSSFYYRYADSIEYSFVR
uniref:HlyD family efflux transporter periplasmic adaptor subunit n=1 Tax=Faecousia sp. TaxID=2952921 RepID=UPI004025D3D2